MKILPRQKIVIALPKGRIAEELVPLFAQIDIIPEKAFFDESSRLLKFATNHAEIEIIRVRSFDVVTYIAYAAADIGVVGRDVLMEFDYPEIYAPLDLGIGKCRLSIAAPVGYHLNWNDSHLRVATKYPNLTKKYFAAKAIQAECIKLNGAMELAPKMGLADMIVDLVESGNTLRANNLQEIEVIADISSLMISNRTSYKTKSKEIYQILSDFMSKL